MTEEKFLTSLEDSLRKVLNFPKEDREPKLQEIMKKIIEDLNCLIQDENETYRDYEFEDSFREGIREGEYQVTKWFHDNWERITEKVEEWWKDQESLEKERITPDLLFSFIHDILIKEYQND